MTVSRCKRRSGPGGWSLLFLATLLVWTSGLDLGRRGLAAKSADDVRTSDPALLRRYRRREKKQWDKARTFLLSAWRIQKHWKIAVNLGRAEVQVGKSRDAAEHLEFFLREAPVVKPEERKAVEAMLKEATAKVGALQVKRAAHGAEVSVDGELVGKAPLKGELFVEPERKIRGEARRLRERRTGGDGRGG